MPGENAPDEAIRDPLQSFRVQIFRPVIDQITTSINERFSVNAELIKNTASFDPQRFDELLENGIQLESRVDWSQRYLFVHLLKNAYDFYIYFDTTFKQIHAVLANM